MMASTGMLPTNPGSGVTQASATADQVFNRNCETVLVATPYTLQTVIKWHAHDKSPGETFLEYTVRIDQNLAGSEARRKQRKNINDKQEPKWNERSLNASFDTTFCAAMLRMMFDIARESTMLTNEEQMYIKMGDAVKAIKDKRNELLHSTTLAYDANWRSGMAPKLHDVLQLAGDLYIRDLREIQSAADELQKKLNHNLTHEEKERIKNDITLLGGKTVAGERVLKFFGKVQSAITHKTVERRSIFHALKLLLKNPKPHMPDEIEYSKLFDDPDSEQFIIISGYPGAGKSTLAKNIALQFYSPDSPKPSLTDFDLLVFHEFRDRKAKDFNDIVSNNYKSVCDVIGVESTVECLLKYKVLYVIDGYDEKNKSSVDALDDLVSKVREGESKVIITSRPNAAVELERYLNIKNVQFQHYTIARISKLENQIDFLTKHQSFFHNTNNPTSDVVTAFQNLNKTLREELDLPIYLIQFCEIHWRDPLRIRNWETFKDFSKGVRKLFRDLIVDRFPNELTNKNDLAENLLLVVGEVALEKIRVNTLLLSDAEYLDMRTRLIQVLKEDKVDVDIILEVVLLTRTSFFDFDSLAYEFNHKSICERLASSFVAHRLRSDGNISLKKLLLGSTLEYSNEDLVVNATSETLGRTTQSTTYSLARFLEVLQYVAQDLNTGNPHHLRAHWPQLRDALLHSGARLYNWCELVLSCPPDKLLVRLAAEAARDQGEEWIIDYKRDAAAVARMLPYAQPQMLYVRVDMEDFHSMKTSWPEIAKLRDGDLKLHQVPRMLGTVYIPCDDLLAPLQQSRCRLQYLKGCIATAAGVAAVASVATPTAELNIILCAPLALNSLQGKDRTLKVVRIYPMDAGDGGQGPAPLPAQPPPAL